MSMRDLAITLTIALAVVILGRRQGEGGQPGPDGHGDLLGGFPQKLGQPGHARGL